MAKNVIEARKRIAHNKNLFDDGILEGESALPSCLDYVSSIMQDMDNNFTAGYSNNLKAQSSISRVKSTQNNNEKNTIPPTDNQGHLQNANVFKSKKFGIARKFPLMEKSQKTLKQLRHNRRLPKPRAHLASTDLPSKENPIDNLRTSTLRINKSNQEAINSRAEVWKKSISNKFECSKYSELQPGPSSKSKEESKKTRGKKADSCNVKKNSDLTSVPTEDDSVPCNSSNGSTTDSEYEEFLKQAKKGLKKKCKKQKVSLIKRNASKKASKIVAKNTDRKIATKLVSSEEDSFTEEDLTLDRLHNKNKRIKIASKEKPADSDSEFEADNIKRIKVASENKLSISADSDSQPQNSPISPPLEHSDPLEASTLYDSCYRRSARNKKYKGIVDEKRHASVECNDESNDEDSLFNGEAFSRDSTSESDLENPKVIRNSTIDPQPAPLDNCNLSSELHCLLDENNVPEGNVPDNNVLATTNEFPNVCSDLCLLTETNAEVEQRQSPDVLVIDLNSDSENESPISVLKIEKPAVNQVESQMQSEESDIEIVDVVIKEESCKKKVNIKVEKNSSVSSVDSQKLPNSIVKVEQEAPAKKNSNEQCNAIYNTNICAKQNEVTNLSHLDNNITITPNTNQPSASKNIVSVKEEVCDDDIVILDSHEPLIKRNTATVSKSSHQVSKEFPSDMCSALQLYKREFKAYQEILQTEATVGAAFKLLESQQAEKLMAIKERLIKPIKQTYNEKMKNDVENVINVKKETDSLIGSSQISNLKTFANKLAASSQELCSVDFEASHSLGAPSAVSVSQGLRTSFSAADVSSPVFISTAEMKPNIYQLQAILKTEPDEKVSSASSKTNTSFGEKCTVCGKEAVAACQQCAKVFFCSDECGKKYWINGHETECGK